MFSRSRRLASSRPAPALIESLERRALFASDTASGADLPGLTEKLTASTAAQPTSDESTRPDDQRVISWYIIGFSAINDATRNIGWQIPETGWKQFVSTYVQPQIDWGVKRIMLHNPFGALGGEDMQFSQLAQAQQAGLTRVADTAEFVAAWKPVTDEGIEVIAYIGSPGPADKLYAQALTASGDLNVDGRVNIDDYALLAKGSANHDLNGDSRLNVDDYAVLDTNIAGFTSTSAVAVLEGESIQPLLDAGMSIAFDAASGYDIHSPVYTLASRLKADGTTVYIEALAPASATHWYEFPAMALTWFWDNPDRPSWNLIESPVENVILISDPPEGETWSDFSWRTSAYQSYLGTDRTIAVGAWDFVHAIESGMTFSQLTQEWVG